MHLCARPSANLTFFGQRGFMVAHVDQIYFVSLVLAMVTRLQDFVTCTIQSFIGFRYKRLAVIQGYIVVTKFCE